MRVARRDGASAMAARVIRKAADRLEPPGSTFPLFLEDIVGSPADARPGITWRDRGPADPLIINWVTTPPGKGSGGHTTMLRLVEHLESRGHVCRLYLYDRYLGDIREHARVVRACWPGVQAEVLDVRSGMAAADAMFATSWPTAHVVARAGTPGAKFYLVQDFEPSFYGTGSERILAENTYRFGLHGITAGRWLEGELAAEYGMSTDGFEFGCDADVYKVTNLRQRNGIVFYAKPDVPRRAFVLGALALAEFARRRPEVDIHLFGDRPPNLPFRVIDHGRISPAEINEIYNGCAAGLSLSLTNVSLVPWEMLASGCIPVVNDAEHNRIVLANPDVRYSALTTTALADALCSVVAEADHGRRAQSVAARVAGANWADAGEAVQSVLRRELCGRENSPGGKIPISMLIDRIAP